MTSPQSTLDARISVAEAVVAGTVRGIESVDRQPRVPFSHHEPLWLAVKIRVDSVLKGNLPDETVVVEIARSPDPRVDSGLYPEVGQQGIWILHRNEDGRLLMAQSVDYQPMEDAQRVSRLIQSQR